jgi:hypothetical protein
MSNPTTPFGWQMPENTDLVTDLPADFEVFGQAVATSMQDLLGGTTGQVLAKASNTDMDFVWSADAAGMTNPMTTTGDSIYSSSGSTPARLGIGTTGQVLTVAGGLPSWATPAGAASYSLLNAGGTALTGSSVTVSGISGKETIYVLLSDVQMDTNEATMRIRINADTGANYQFYGSAYTVKTTYAASIFGSTGSGGSGETQINLAKSSSSGTSIYRGGFTIQAANSTGIKTVDTAGGFTNGSGENNTSNNFRGIYTGSSTVSSVTIFANTGNFSSGTVYVYTTA